MGKVYEALSRAQNREGDLDLFDEVEEEQEESGEQEPAPEKFNFMRYSLGTTALVARDRNGRGRSPAALMTRPMTLPGRELTISTERIDPHLVVFNNRDPRASQQYNKLALALISKAAERGFKRVLVASAQEGEGRTCVTLNLACALARARQRVLVVDCDLLNPSVMRALGLRSELGMQEALEQELPPGAAAVAIRPYGFNVLPATRPVDNPALMFAAPGFWKMLQAFDADHDFILFDSSPLATGGELSLLVRYTHTTLLVIRAGHTSSSEMAKAITPFAQDDILGVVINRAKD
jgi:Mrp family chromosome partitioning ATPase